MNRWELPEGWEWTTVGEIAEVRLGRQRSPDRATGPNLRPYLRAANVTWDGLDLSDVKEMDFSPKEQAVFELKPGDILLSEASGSASEVGKPALWNGEIEGCCFQNTLVRVRAGTELAPYLLAYLRHTARSGVFAEASKGSGIHHLGQEGMALTDVPLPPPDEQTRIVTRLNALQARIQSARAGLDELRQLAAALKRSVLDAAFRGDLTAAWREAHPGTEPASALLDRLRADRRRSWQEAHPKKPYVAPEPVDPTDLPELPEGWCWAALGEVLTDLRNGIATKPANETGQAILRISAVRPMALDIRDVRYLPLGTYESFQLADGDLLFTRYNGNAELVGACAVVRGVTSPLVYPDKLIRGRLDEVDPEFIAAMVAGGPSRAYLDSRARSAAGQVGISGNDIRLTPVPLAPLAEQRQVAAMVTRAWSTMAGVIEAARPLADDLTTTEHALLTAAFRGDLLPPVTP